jgi:hypothetical protein
MLQSKVIQRTVATPAFLRNQIQAPECGGLVFETSWQDKTFFVGVGVGGIDGRKLWMSEVSQMVLEILSDVPSINKELAFAQVNTHFDVKETLRFITPYSKVMFLGNMTEALQNSIIQELNIS